MEDAVLMADVQPVGDLQCVIGGYVRGQFALPRQDRFHALAFDHRPGEVMQAAGGADIHEGHDRGLVEVLEGTHLAAGQADVPHAAPRQHLDGVPLIVLLGERLVDRTHAAGADGVHQGVRPEDQALRLALQDAIGLELRDDLLANQIFRQLRRFGARMLLEEFAHDLVELAAVDQVAASKVPDEPFTSPEISGRHN